MVMTQSDTRSPSVVAKPFDFMKTPKHKTREEWLNAAVKEIEPRFKDKGRAVPTVRVSIGWPSRQALGKRRAIGQCWSPECSKDKTTEIFISPCIDEIIGPNGILSTLTHEMVHAAVGNQAGHKKPFADCARAVGLSGKWTECGAEKDSELEGFLKTVHETLGEFPHARLDATKSETKKQSTRLIKCECGKCGFNVRMTRKWLADVGPAHCPKHGAMQYKLPEGMELELLEDLEEAA